MIQTLPSTSVAAPAARRGKPAETDHPRAARPQPATESDAAIVDLDHGGGKDASGAAVVTGGFGLDLAYSRQVMRTNRQGLPVRLSASTEAVSLEFRFATAALPRDAAGEVDVEALANTDQKNALSEAITRIVEEGFKDPGALASFVNAVDDLFGEYEKDLGLSEGALQSARAGFVDEVEGFFARAEQAGAVPAGAQTPAASTETPPDLAPDGFESLDAAINGLLERVLARRRDVLTAAGDLSKVLAELTSDAGKARPGTETEKVASAHLGDYLKSMADAQSRKSTKPLRESARERLQKPDAEIPERNRTATPSEASAELGRAFLLQLRG